MFRDLDTLEQSWGARDCACSGVLHVGFERPDEREYSEYVEIYPRRLLLTDGARFALPQDLVVSTLDIGNAYGQRVHLVQSGLGYEIEVEGAASCPAPLGASSFEIDGMHPFFDVYHSRPDWLAKLRVEAPAVADLANGAGVTDEATYLAMESILPDELREDLGWRRYVYYAGLLPCADSLLRSLRFAPPWLLDVEIESMDLSVRARNGLKAKAIVKVRDIIELGAEGLKATDNIGLKSFQEIATALLERFASGPWTEGTKESAQVQSMRFDTVGSQKRIGSRSRHSRGGAIRVQESDFGSALDALEAALKSRRERSRRILELRMGLNGPKHTLDQVGRMLGLTRERVRQVEKRECDKISSTPVWRRLSDRIESLLTSRSLPLPIEGLEVLDPWFKGIDRSVSAFAYILKMFCGGRHSLVTIGDGAYVSGITQSQWDRCVFEGKDIIAGFVARKVSESAARAAIDGLLASSGSELRDLLWAETTAHAHFSGPGGFLVSFGLGVQHAVEAVLAESDRPLHYSEIAKRCTIKLGRNVELRRAHSAAASVGLLYGRGVYGLRSHAPFTDLEFELLMREAEDVVLEQPHRQWHSSEIVTSLQDRGFEIDDKLNSYLVSIALGDSHLVTSLKRSVWIARSAGAQGANDRIDVAQAIHSVLIEAGHPLSSAEIRDKVSRLRGVSSHFQINPGDDVVRTGPGEWGLASRDVTIDDDDIASIQGALMEELSGKAQGIHISEVIPLLERLSCAPRTPVSPETIVDLATRDGLLRRGRGQYVYVSSWEGPRRPTLAQAVSEVLEAAPTGGVAVGDMEHLVAELLGRQVSESSLVAALSDIGADFIEEAGKWVLGDDRYVEADEALSS